jgi:GDP-L-fucose synthase
VYGPGDDPAASAGHVLGSLLARFRRAVNLGENEVTVWGTGRPRREFLFAEDFAEAAYLLMARYDGPEPVNAGSGRDTAIADLAALIARITGFQGTIRYDTTKPDGVMRKLLDSRRAASLGWRPRFGLEEGIRLTAAEESHTRKEISRP